MGSAAKNIPFRNVNKSPERGDVFYADLSGIEQSIGSEQKGKRPVIIIQNNVGNAYSTTTIIAVMTTNTKKNLPTHVIIRNKNVLQKESAICLEQIKTIDKSRLEGYCGNVGKAVLKNVDKAIAISLGICGEKQLEEKGDDVLINIVKKETVYDGHPNDWMLLAERQLEFFTNIKQYIINLKCEKEQIDKEIEDILEYMESTHCNAVRGYKVYKMLRDRRMIRKKKIKEMGMLEALLENFDCEAMRKAYQSSVAKMHNVVQSLETSKTFKELADFVG